MSNDLRSIDQEYVEVLQNQYVTIIQVLLLVISWFLYREVIAVDQDPKGAQGRLVAKVQHAHKYTRYNHCYFREATIKFFPGHYRMVLMQPSYSILVVLLDPVTFLWG